MENEGSCKEEAKLQLLYISLRDTAIEIDFFWTHGEVVYALVL